MDSPAATPARFAAGVGFQALGRAVHGAVSFAALVLLAQALDPAAVGVYASAVAFFGLLDTLVDSGSVLALVRRGSSEPHSFRPLLARARRLRAGTAGAATLAALTYLALDPRVALAGPWGWLAALTILSHVPGVDGAVFNLRLEFGLPAAVRALTALAALAGLAWLAAAQVADPLAYLCVTQARAAITNLWLWAAARPRIARYPDAPADTRGFIRESFALGLGGLLREGYVRADVLLLRWLAGADAAGLYAPARSALNFAMQWPSYLLTVALPPLAAAAHRDFAVFRAQVWRLARNLALFAWPAALFSLPLAPWFLSRLFGAEYLAAAPALRLLAAAAALAYPGSAVLTALIARGGARSALWISALAMLFSTAMALLLVPRWPLTGAALARTGAEIVTFALPAFLVLGRPRPQPRP